MSLNKLDQAISEHLKKFPVSADDDPYTHVPSFSVEIDGKSHFIHVSPYNLNYNDGKPLAQSLKGWFPYFRIRNFYIVCFSSWKFKTFSNNRFVGLNIGRLCFIRQKHA